jgi:hypothetical protein
MTEDEERCEFYAAIGEGITEWTRVEDMLFFKFAKLFWVDRSRINALRSSHSINFAPDWK